MVAINAEPDGRNINLNSGSLHIEGLQKKVIDEKADLGVAFDGDAETEALLADLERSSGLTSSAPGPLDESRAMVVPVEIRAAHHRLRFFSTITTLGAPQDVTLAELRIEAFHPADEATALVLRHRPV